MRYFTISESFFKAIAEKGNLYSRLWIYWLGEYVDEIFKPEFLENQVKNLNKHIKESEISEIYHYGLQFLKDFKIPKEKSSEKIETSGKVIDYLNSVCGTTFKKTENNISLITARQDEGFTLSDFKIVIDKKYNEWKGTEQAKYLRPITLFTKKHFENYLNSVNEQQSTKFSQFADAIDRAKELIKVRKQ
jgi:uncharacterized phage protein (TIGR02220 family)